MNDKDFQQTVRSRFPNAKTLAEEIHQTMQYDQLGTIVVIRGMPGSGKTTFANELAYCASRLGARFEICDPVEFQYDENGHIHDDTATMNQARELFFERVNAALARGVDCVIVDVMNASWCLELSWLDVATAANYKLRNVSIVCESLDEAIENHDRSHLQFGDNELSNLLAYHQRQSLQRQDERAVLNIRCDEWAFWSD